MSPQLSPLPLLLRGRWLYRYAPGQGWSRESLDGSKPAPLSATQQRRLGPLLQRQLRRRQGLAPMPVEQIADDAARRFGLPTPATLNRRLQPCALPRRLLETGHDRFGRVLRLEPATAQAFERLRQAASADGIAIDVVSGFRSPGHQAAIWQRKLAAGQSLRRIARVSAPPGRSEHHSGRALDLASGPGPVLESSFARTDAYRWLRRHAGRFGFVESYLPGNALGVMAEPWHWCFRVGNEPD